MSNTRLNSGFSEVTEERLNYKGSDPWFLEVAITGKCNFACKYCNRFSEELDIEAFQLWLDRLGVLKHIQITGGEPTIHPQFRDILALCRKHSNVIGLSTNASWGISNYLSTDVEMFSISLDDYDLNVLKKRGYQNPEQVVETISVLFKERYVNVGMVIDELNLDRAEEIVDYILGLGAQDVKLSISTKAYSLMPVFTKSYEGHPILSYRVKNFNEGKPMRGYPAKLCSMVSNDVTIVGDKHYPCLVYFREKGAAIGFVKDPNMLEDRNVWGKTHDCTQDPICKRYCMDFKCDFNLIKEGVAEHHE